MANLANRRIVANALAVLALGGIGAYTVSTCWIKNASAESRSAEPQKVFGRGPAFKSLRLHSSESVNDNTKRLRFELPGGESSISGLSLTCESASGLNSLRCWTRKEKGWGRANLDLTQLLSLRSRGQKVAGYPLCDRIRPSANWVSKTSQPVLLALSDRIDETSD